MTTPQIGPVTSNLHLLQALLLRDLENACRRSVRLVKQVQTIVCKRTWQQARGCLQGGAPGSGSAPHAQCIAQSGQADHQTLCSPGAHWGDPVHPPILQPFQQRAAPHKSTIQYACNHTLQVLRRHCAHAVDLHDTYAMPVVYITCRTKSQALS